MNRLLKRKDKKQESPNEIPTPQAQPAPPPPPPDPFIEKIVQFRQKITDRIPSKNARIASRPKMRESHCFRRWYFLSCSFWAPVMERAMIPAIKPAWPPHWKYMALMTRASALAARKDTPADMMQAMKKATPPPFRKHRPRPRLHTTKAMPPDTMKAKTLAMPKVKKQAMRPEKPRALPLDTIRATPREKQQPPRKPAIPARALARKMLVKSKRRALRFM